MHSCCSPSSHTTVDAKAMSEASVEDYDLAAGVVEAGESRASATRNQGTTAAARGPESASERKEEGSRRRRRRGRKCVVSCPGRLGRIKKQLTAVLQP